MIASHDAAFGEQDNVVSFTEVWVTQLAVVVRPHSATDVGLSGHVVFARSGEPVAGASVQAFSRKFQDNAMTLVESQKVKSDAQGRFVLKSEGQDLHVVVAESVIDGTTHAAASQPLWIGQSHPIERQQRSLVVTDRAIYRPGQTIHYKAIAYHFHSAPGKPQQYGVLPEHAVTLVLRDVNSQEIAHDAHDQCIWIVCRNLHRAFKDTARSDDHCRGDGCTGCDGYSSRGIQAAKIQGRN